MSVLSRNIVTSGLRMDQTACENDYMAALSALTLACPAVWTEFYTGKKTATALLASYLHKATPGMQITYWSSLDDLLRNIPQDLLEAHNQEPRQEATEEENSKAITFPILEAIQGCISRQARLRADQGPAWSAYLGATDKSAELIEDGEVKRTLISNHVLPLVSLYVMVPTDSMSRGAAIPDGLETSVKAFQQIVMRTPAFATDCWQRLSATVIEAIQTSSPEQSKEYQKSQDGVGAMLQRWYNLLSELSKGIAEHTVADTCGLSLAREVQVISDVLESRKGKPYGAAIGLASMMSCLPSGTNIARENYEKIFNFLRKNMSALIGSPSSVYLMEILPRLRSDFDAGSLYQAAFNGLAEISNEDSQAASEQLLRSDNLYSCIGSQALNEFLETKLREAIEGNDQNWDLIKLALANSGLITELQGNVISIIFTSIQSEKTQKSGLRGLALLTDHYGHLFQDGDGDSDLESRGILLKLLQFSESFDEEDARNARNTLTHLSTNASKTRLLSIAKAIALAVTSNECTSSVPALVNHAHNILSIYEEAGYDMEELPSTLLPTGMQWRGSLDNVMYRRPRLGIAVTGTLDILFLSQSFENASVPSQPRTASEDNAYISKLLRIVIFTIDLIKLDFFRDHCSQQTLAAVLQDILISQAIIESFRQAGFDDTLEDLELKESDAHLDIKGDTISCIDASGEQVSTEAQTELAASCQGEDVASYYKSQAYSFLTSYSGGLGDDVEKLKSLRRSPYIFYSTQILKSWKNGSSLLKLCNELLADLTGLLLTENRAQGKVQRNRGKIFID